MNNLPMIPFSPPRMDQKIIDEVVDTLKSGWITTGPKTKLFENKISEFTQASKTLCLNSASAGLELVLRWYGVGAGDEVIVPAYTYAATANVVVHCGAKVVFVDVNDQFLMDAQKVNAAITERTKVIMPVDIGGMPADYDALNQLVNSIEVKSKFKPENEVQNQLGRILILSDAAHSLGAYYKGKAAGILTDVTVFSFHAVKNLTTAEGGAICLNLPQGFDVEQIYKELNLKSLHGQNKDALAKTQIGNWRYDIVEAGYKCNMTDIAASIGLIELERYQEDMLVKRKYIFDQYAEAFSHFEWAIVPSYETEVATSSYHVFMLRINGATEAQRDAIIQHIFDYKVSVNVHFIPLPSMSYYRSLGYDMANYPQTYALYSNEISLPVYYDLNDQQLQRVIDAVISAVNKVL